MQYGICGTHEIAGVARQAGFAYAEYSVDRLLKPKEDPTASLSRAFAFMRQLEPEARASAGPSRQESKKGAK